MGRRGICVKGLTEMKGIHKVVVGTKYLKYEFELRRNLTIIRGDSATGKTTLVDMIRTHMNDGESGPVTLNCDKGCYVVEGNLWKGQLDNIQDSIVLSTKETSLSRPKILRVRFSRRITIMLS